MYKMEGIQSLSQHCTKYLSTTNPLYEHGKYSYFKILSTTNPCNSFRQACMLWPILVFLSEKLSVTLSERTLQVTKELLSHIKKKHAATLSVCTWTGRT